MNFGNIISLCYFSCCILRRSGLRFSVSEIFYHFCESFRCVYSSWWFIPGYLLVCMACSRVERFTISARVRRFARFLTDAIAGFALIFFPFSHPVIAFMFYALDSALPLFFDVRGLFPARVRGLFPARALVRSATQENAEACLV